MRLGTAVLALWTIANLGLSAWLLISRSPAEVSADGRTPIRLSMEAQDAVRDEMRLMLGSVQGVIDGASRADTAAIRKAAAASGVATAADPALEGKLPGPFMQMGMATHMGFDTLAANAGAGSGIAIEQLSRIMSNCVSCHATYRLAAK